MLMEMGPNVLTSTFSRLKYAARKAGIAQLVEHNLAKVGVASSNLVSRSKISEDGRLWLGGRVVMRRPAKPFTSVRFRP